eukprot:g11321.t1
MDVLFYLSAAVGAQGVFALGLACMLGLLLRPVAGRRSPRPAAYLVPRNCAWGAAHLLYLVGGGGGRAIWLPALAWPVWTEGLVSLPLGLIPTQGRRLVPRRLGRWALAGHGCLLLAAVYSGRAWLAEAAVAAYQLYNGWVLSRAGQGLRRRLCQAGLCTRPARCAGRGAYVAAQLRLMSWAFRGSLCLHLSYLAAWLALWSTLWPGRRAPAWRAVVVTELAVLLALLELLLSVGQLWHYHSARAAARRARASSRAAVLAAGTD